MEAESGRITPGMHIPHMSVALAGGNEEAISVLRKVAYTTAISESDRYVILYALDKHHIYGDRLRRLFQNVCSGDPDKVLALFKSIDMGLGVVTAEEIQEAIDSQDPQLDIDAIYIAYLDERQRRFFRE